MRLKGLNFEVKAGEILGIAGVDGNGQSELIEALTGLRTVDSGRVLLDAASDITESDAERNFGSWYCRIFLRIGISTDSCLILR